MVTYILKLSRSPILSIGNDNIQSDQSLRFFHSIIYDRHEIIP